MSLAEDRSTRAYEREADQTRRHLSSSLDELASNLTPGRMLDEVLSYARAGGGDFLRGLGNAAAADPMPTLLIGLGAAMFLTGRGRVDNGSRNGGANHGASLLRHAADEMGRRTRPRHERPGLGDLAASAGLGVGSAVSGVGDAATRAGRGVASAASNMAESVGSTASSAAAAVGSAATGVADAVGSAASSAADAAGSAASRVASGVRAGAAAVGTAATDAAGAIRDTAAAGAAAAGDLASSAGEVVSSAAGTVAESAKAAAASVRQFANSTNDMAAEQSRHLYDHTAQLARDLTQRTNRLIREQPLAVAAAGLAIGAAIAAVLPRTRTEDALLGETSDAVKDTIAGAASEQFHQAKEATGRVVEEVKHVAEKEGLSATAAVDMVRDIGKKVKNVVISAADPGKDENSPQTGGRETSKS